MPISCFTPCHEEEGVVVQNRQEASAHWLYQFIPRHRSQIRWYDLGHWTTWMLFGNDDDGIFGEFSKSGYRLNQDVCFSKALDWACRNPLHNFCFYVIGSAHRQNSEFTFVKLSRRHMDFFHYLPQGHTNFADTGTSFFVGLHGGKPFISLRLRYSPCWKSDFYIGWRERGNFGIKCLPLHHASGETANKLIGIVPVPKNRQADR